MAVMNSMQDPSARARQSRWARPDDELEILAVFCHHLEAVLAARRRDQAIPEKGWFFATSADLFAPDQLRENLTHPLLGTVGGRDDATHRLERLDELLS